MVDKLEMILFFSIMSLTLLGLVSAADWSFEPLDEPYNNNNFSINTSTVFLTHLKTNEGDKISPDDIQNYEGLDDKENPPYVVFEYEVWNSSSDSAFTVNESLSYHDRLGVWYADFKPNYTGMNEITFKAQGDLNVSGGVDSNGEANITETVEVSEVNTTLLRDNLELDFSQPVKADREDKFDVRTLNITDGSALNDNDVDVEVYFHNLSEVDSRYRLDNYNDNPMQDGGQYHFNSEVSTPSPTDQAYVLRINSSTPEGTYSTESFFIETAPAINGEVADLSSSGCDETVQNCEPDASVNAEFDVTAASAEGVNATVYGFNISNGESVNLSTVQMNEVSASEGALQTFDADVMIPDVNTSKYEKNLELEFHAWNNERSYSENHSMTLRTFTLQDRSNPTAFKGLSHDMRLFFGKAFSVEPYNKSRFDEIQVNLTGPGNFNESYTANDFDYVESDGVMSNSVVIPESASSGTYNLDISATNIYNETKTFNSGLNVRDVNATFAASGEAEFDYNELGVFTENLTIESLVDTEKTLGIENDMDIIDVPEEVTLAPNQETDLEFEINLSEPESYTGEITFMDSSTNYNETVEITVNGPECEILEGDLCISHGEIDFETDEASPVTETLDITNLGNQELEVETGLTGNISDYINVDQNMTVQGTESLDVVFDTQTPGSYEGELTLTGNESEAAVNLTADADFEASDPGLTVSPTTLDLGTVIEGESVAEEVTVENTGEVAVNDIEVSSPDYNFSIEMFSLQPGETNDLELQIDEPQASTVTFAGQAAGDEVTAEMMIEANVIEDYSARTDEIQDRVSELRGRATSTETETDLTEVSAMVDQINSQWDQGNYEEAQSIFQDAQSELDTIEADIQSQNTGGGDDQTDEPEESGGGLPILPFIMIFFVLAAIGGFVFYESYIPEEGDPLYGVLGE